MCSFLPRGMRVLHELVSFSMVSSWTGSVSPSDWRSRLALELECEATSDTLHLVQRGGERGSTFKRLRRWLGDPWGSALLTLSETGVQSPPWWRSCISGLTEHLTKTPPSPWTVLVTGGVPRLAGTCSFRNVISEIGRMTND